MKGVKNLKINLAILDYDSTYLRRLSTALSMRFGEKLEVNTFTSEEKLMQFLELNKLDLLLLNEEASREFQNEYIGLLAYLVDKRNVEELNGKRAICKYQKLEMFYRSVVGICSENDVGGFRYFSSKGSTTSVTTFISGAGGVGTSSVAAAYCMRKASIGKKVFYLNLEQFGSPRAFFSGDGNQNLSDIIFAIKCKKSSISIKLESGVTKDKCGVYFFDESNLPLDLFELTADELNYLIGELIGIGFYDLIVVDFNYHLESAVSTIMKVSDEIFIVTDCSRVSKIKMNRMIDTLKVLDKQNGMLLIPKISVVINKVPSIEKTAEKEFDMPVYALVNKIIEESLEKVLIGISNQLP